MTELRKFRCISLGLERRRSNDSNTGPAQRGHCIAQKSIFLGWLNVLENIETIKCPEGARRRSLQHVVAEELDRISIAGCRLRGLDEFRIEIDRRQSTDRLRHDPRPETIA